MRPLLTYHRAYRLVIEAYRDTASGYLGVIRDYRRVHRCGIRQAIAALARLERRAARYAKG